MFAPRAPLTSTRVGTSARQPRKRCMFAPRAPLTSSTSLVGIVQLARTAGLGPADGGSSPSSDSADPVRPSKLGSNSFNAVTAGAVMRFQTSSCKVQSFVAAPSSSGSGPAWQGVRFGSGRSGVRISPPRQNRISNSIGRRLGFYPRGSGFESQGMHVSTSPSRAGSSGAATGS